LPFRDAFHPLARFMPALMLTALVAQTQNLTVILSPGANVQSIVNANPENTTFVIQAGLYRLQSIQPKNGDSFVGQNSPVLSGAQVLKTFTQKGSYWVAGGQTQQGQLNGVCLAQFPMCEYPEDLFFDNLPLLHVASLSAVGPGSWYFDYPNHNIYCFDNPSGHLVETSVTRSAFWGSAANVTISGLTVEKYAIPAQFGAIGDQYPGPNWIVKNNEVRWNHGTGINLLSGSMAALNYVHNNGQKGIGGNGSNVLVQGNRVSFNNWAGFDPAWEAGGIKFAVASNLTIRGNTVDDNVGPGIWTDVGSINTLYESNVIMNNTNGPGIQDEISYSAIIRYNTVCYNSMPQPTWLWGSQIMIQNSQNVQVYGNDVETPLTGGNGIGIIYQNRGSGTLGPYLAINNSVHNNNIVYRGIGTSGEVADYNEPAFLQSGNNSFDYNAYHLINPYGYFWQWINYVNWTGLRQAGQELHGSVDAVFPPIQ
jgi:parallel beta-helix repeat protein